jgi:lysozyme
MAKRSSRGNKGFFWFSVVMLLFIGSLLVFFLADKWRQRSGSLGYLDDYENTFSSYPGFGIWIPDHFEVHGIDVSKYQKRINWKLVRQMNDRGLQLHFAFMKATEGKDVIDPQFARNWKKAKEAGMVVGAYHFFRQSSGGHEQALFFMRQVNLQVGDLPPVLDVETFQGSGVDQFLDEVETWLKLVENRYGHKPIIYTNAGFYNQYLAGRFDDYPLWVAHYQNRNSPRVNRSWQFWQHNEGGRVNGIRSLVDFNVFNGTLEDFNALLIPKKLTVN